jgi:hypothetical protein
MKTIFLTWCLLFIELTFPIKSSNVSIASSLDTNINVIQVNTIEIDEKTKIDSLLVDLDMYHLFSKQNKKTVKTIASKLNFNQEWLYKIIYLESRGLTHKQNPGSKATGLIQFLPSTAEYLGTSTDELKTMTTEEQLFYVDKYLTFFCKDKHIRSFDDLYLSVFHPAAIGQKEAYIIASYPSKRYKLNSNIDVDKDGSITVKDLSVYVSNRIN